MRSTRIMFGAALLAGLGAALAMPTPAGARVFLLAMGRPCSRHSG